VGVKMGFVSFSRLLPPRNKGKKGD